MKPETRQLVRSNLGYFYLAQNPDYHFASFQQDYIVPALHKLARHEIDALALLMPPRHAKSDLCSLNFMPWLFGQFPKRSNMLLSYSDKFAKRFGRKILNGTQTEVFHEAFPECQISPTARSGSYFATTAGGQFFSAGFNGTITGQGVDGVLGIDDPIKNMDEARSSATMDSRMEDYKSSAKTRLEGGSRYLAMTRWCRGDFWDRLVDEEGLAEDGGLWTVLKFPAEAGEDDPLDRAPGEFLWPQRFDDKHYIQNKKSTRTWTALFQQDPQSEHGKYFKREWLCFYPKAIRPGKFPTYMLTDPAKSKESQHDRTAIQVWAATPEKRLLLVDCVLGRLDPDERASESIRLLKKWKPHKWLYEEYGLMNDTWYLGQRAKKEGVGVHPIAVGRKGPRHMLSKESRIEGLIPDFREGRIWLPDPEKVPFATVKIDDNEEMSIIDYFINEEYLEYSGDESTAFDDMLDCCSRLHEPECGISYPKSAMATDVYRELEGQQRRASRGTTWESQL